MRIKAVITEYTTSLIHVPIQSSKDFTVFVNNKKIWKGGEFIGANNKFHMIPNRTILLYLNFNQEAMWLMQRMFSNYKMLTFGNIKF